MRAAHRRAGVRQASEPRYPLPVERALALVRLGCLQITERVSEWTAEGRREPRILVNPRSGRKRERERQVRVAGQRVDARGRRRGCGEYLKQGVGQRSVSDPSQREPEESGERKRRIGGEDAGKAEDAGEVEIG